MRNAVVACAAAFAPRLPASGTFECRFRVMPWEVGTRILNSERYYAVAEAAQVDLVMRTGLMFRMVREGVHWANVAQVARFRAPLKLLQSFTVVTQIECADTKHAYLAHRFVSPEGEHALVGVKAKFKRGSLTVPPRELFGDLPDAWTALAQSLDGLA